MARRSAPEVVSITSAPQTYGEELGTRQRRYLFSMAIRTVCFVGAVAVGSGILRWVLVVGAVFLPYIAVVMANRITPRPPGDAPPAPGPGREQALPPGRAAR